MEFRQGKKSHTIDLVYDSFSQGCNLVATEHRHRDFGLVRGLLYGENFDITPSGELRVRPDAAPVVLRDPETFDAITEPFIGLVPFPRLGGGMEWLAVTATRVFRLAPDSFLNLEELKLKVPIKSFTGEPSEPPIEDDYTADGQSMRSIQGVSWTPKGGIKAPLLLTTSAAITAAGEHPATDLGIPTHYWVEYSTTDQILSPTFLVHLYPIPDKAGTLCVEGEAFLTPADVLDWEIYQNHAYLATGTNHLLRWDGQGAELEDVSQWYDEGYRFPGCIKRHMGRLVMSGFTDLSDTRAQSALRFSGIADPLTLSEYIFEARTTDDDAPTALASLQSGLATTDQAIGRSTPCLLVFKRRNTLAMVGTDFSEFSDVSMGAHSPGVGCVGPQAWCYGQKGIYFASDWGIHLVSGMAPAECVSRAMAPLWGREGKPSDVPVPSILSQELASACLWFDPESRRVFCHLPRVMGT